MTNTKTKFHSVQLETLEIAREVSGGMRERVALYGFASVADIYDLCGVPTTFADTRWGWTNVLEFANSKIKEIEGGFEIAPSAPHRFNPMRSRTVSMNLCYYLPDQDRLIDASMKFESTDASKVPWLHHMVEANPDTIFFFVVDSTDIPEEAFT